MRICLFGTYQKSHPRNVTLTQAMEKLGVEIISCHIPLWDSFHDRSSLVGRYAQMVRVLFGQLAAWIRLAWKYLFLPNHDWVFVLYPGHFDLFLAVCLGHLRRKPVVYDAFLSLFDLYTSDRRYASGESLLGRFFFWIDKTSCHLADKVLVDTEVHTEFFIKKFALDPKKISFIPVGCDETVFNDSRAGTKARDSNFLEVIYFGKYIPFHGVDIIVQAAAILKKKEHSIRWLLIGNGQDFVKVAHLARQLSLGDEIQWITDWVEPHQLAEYIKNTDICLGVFGKGEKADRVIPCKIFNALAMAKPVITGESTAVRQFFQEDQAIAFCERGNANALANAVLSLKQSPILRKSIAEKGYQVYKKKASESAIASKLESLLK